MTEDTPILVKRNADGSFDVHWFEQPYHMRPQLPTLPSPLDAKVLMLDTLQRVPTEFVPGVGRRTTRASYWLTEWRFW